MSDMCKMFTSTRVLLPEGNLEEAGVMVVNGKISAIIKGSAKVKEHCSQTADLEVEDFGDLVIMPGLVDSHVHVNEPGRSEWEGFETATRAAAAGGVTTIADMPLNSIPPTTSVDYLLTKVTSAIGKMHVDVAFWGGVIPGNQDQLLPLLREGVVGFKCFLCPSGVDEFPAVTREDVELALAELKGSSTVLAFHAECELPEESRRTSTVSNNKYQMFLESRQPQMEQDAIKMVTELCHKSGVRCHIVHLSAAQALPLIRAAKFAGARLTVETCYHYLTLAAEKVPENGVEFKCCPPIRGAANKEELWKGLKELVIDMVVSDHSPCPAELKRPTKTVDFMKAWGGIASLQFGLPLLWTEAVNRGLKIADMSRLVSTNTAGLLGLGMSKGRLEVGYDADLVVWDPDTKFTVLEEKIEHKHKLTPYLGRKLQGVVHATIVRGNVVFRMDADDEFGAPMGKTLLKKT